MHMCVHQDKKIDLTGSISASRFSYELYISSLENKISMISVATRYGFKTKIRI